MSAKIHRHLVWSVEPRRILWRGRESPQQESREISLVRFALKFSSGLAGVRLRGARLQVAQHRELVRRRRRRSSRSCAATFSGQPVAFTTFSTSTPGCTLVSVSSFVTGSGVRMPRSVITAAGPLPGSRSRARLSPPSRWPADVTKSSLSTNARVFCRSVISTSLHDAAISGAPPAPGSRVDGLLVIADHRRVDVGEAVDLRGAEEAEIDAAALQPVGEHLGHGRRPHPRSRPARRRRSTAAARSAWCRSCPTRRSARCRARASAARGWRRRSAARCRRTARRRCAPCARRQSSSSRRRCSVRLQPDVLLRHSAAPLRGCA